MKQKTFLLCLFTLLTPTQALGNKEQRAWEPIYDEAISVRGTAHKEQLELQFGEEEEFSPWKKHYSRLISIPDGQQQLFLYNLADTGCLIERKQFLNSRLTNWYLHSSDRKKDYCHAHTSRIFTKDVTDSVQISQTDNTPAIQIDPTTLFQYQADLQSNDRVDYYISSNHQFLILTPINLDRINGEKPQELLPYAPELLLIDLKSKKSQRIAFAGFESLSSIAMDDNDLLLSFANPFADHTAFGDLWRLNLTDFNMLPIEGWQSSACGSASIKMVRGRLESSTSSYTACGGNDAHHQAILLSSTRLETVYAAGLLGDNDIGDSYIQTLFDTHRWHYSQKPIRAGYEIVAQKNHIHLVKLPAERSWPLELGSTPDTATPTTHNAVTLDGWLEQNTLNLDLNVDLDLGINNSTLQKTKTIKLALRFDLTDATNTHDERNYRAKKETFLTISYTLDIASGTSSLMDKDALIAAGIPAATVTLLEQHCCELQTTTHSETELTYRIKMSLASYPVKSISGATGLQISLLDNNNHELYSSRHTRHESQQQGWNYFPNLTQLLRSSWGEKPLPNNISYNNFNCAVLLGEHIYLYNSETETFSAYQQPEIDEQLLKTLVVQWHSVNADDMKSFNANAKIHKIYYRAIPPTTSVSTLESSTSSTQWRLYYFFHAGFGTESGDYLVVVDYTNDGAFLRTSAPLEIQFNCYRCHDNPSINDVEITLYHTDNKPAQELVVIGELAFLFDSEHFTWHSTEGTPDNALDSLLNSNAALPAELEEPSGSYGYITEAPFRIQTDKEIKNELPLLSSKPQLEPLSGIYFQDVHIEKCVVDYLKNAYPNNPAFNAATISELDCSAFPTKNISDLLHFSQLKKLAVAIEAENNAEQIRTLKHLEQLSLTGDSIDLTKLQGASILTLTLTSPSIDLIRLPLLPQLTTLQLKTPEAPTISTEENIPSLNNIEDLYYSGKNAGEILHYFPALKNVTLSHLDTPASNCPSSKKIETLIIENGTWKPISAKCYPNLRHFSVQSQTDSLLVDGPFTHLTQLTANQFNTEIREQAPALTSLTTGIIVDYLPETIEHLTMQAKNRDAICPGGNYLSGIKKATLACNLLPLGYGNLPSIFAHYDIRENTENRANPHYVLKSVKVDLKNQADIKDVWPSYDEQKTKQEWATIEEIEIAGVSGAEFSALFADMPLLKSIKASSYNSYADSDFVFTLPHLPHLTSLSIGSFSKMDLSALEGSPIKELVIRAKEGQKTTLTLDLTRLNALSLLDFGYGFTLSPAALPCSLTSVSGFYAGAQDEQPGDCFAPQKMIISGTEVDANHNIYRALLKATNKTLLYSSTSTDSQIWKATDVNQFFSNRPYMQEKKEELISECKQWNRNYPQMNTLDYFFGACVVEAVAKIRDL